MVRIYFREFIGIVTKIVISILILIISTSVSIADNTNVTNNTDEIKLSLRSTFIEFDKNWNTERLQINVSINKLGHFAYIESYYIRGSEDLKLLSSNRYFDGNITNSPFSFNISRPRSRNATEYSFIKSTVLLDNKTIFETMLNHSNKFTLMYYGMREEKEKKNAQKENVQKENADNNETIYDISKTNDINDKTNDINDKTNDINDKTNDINDKTQQTVSEKSMIIVASMIVVAILGILLILLLRRTKYKKIEQNKQVP